MFEIRPYLPGDADAVIEVWRQSGLLWPTNHPGRDIARKLKVRPDLFLVGTLEGAVIATLMAGYEGHRGVINYFGVLPRYQRRGFGRRMMDHAEALLRGEGCAKINLHVRQSNPAVIEFYRKLGYQEEPVVCLGKRLERDPSSGA
ncbi:MAG TPA: GNAT family acetyltransferase [Opitutaceae bacterium]|nr:GNAT family acetyltransferase [Opitutaceae bacterium]